MVVRRTFSTSSTTWNHHPFAGVFIILKETVESGSLGGYVFSFFASACVIAPLAVWVWAGRVWGAVLAIVASAATVCLSYIAAAMYI